MTETFIFQEGVQNFAVPPPLAIIKELNHQTITALVKQTAS